MSNMLFSQILLAQEMVMEGGLLIAFYSMIALLALACVLLWTRAIGRVAAGEEILDMTPGKSPIGFLDVCVAFGVWFSCQILAGFMLVAVYGTEAMASGDVEKFTSMMLYSSMSQLVATGLIAAYLLIRYKLPSVIGWRSDRLWPDLKIGLMGYLMIIPIVMLIAFLASLWVPYEHPTMKLLASDPRIGTIGVCWFMAVLVAPISEEFFFRGVLQNWLQRFNANMFRSNQIVMGGWYGGPEGETILEEDSIGDSQSDSNLPAVASDNPYRSPAMMQPASVESNGGDPNQNAIIPIVLTSLIFGFLHFGQGAAPIPLFVLSLGLGFLYQRTRSLVPCFIVHFLLNGYSMFWFTVSIYFGEAP